MVSTALLVTVLATTLWSDDDPGADPAASTGASSARTLSPEPGSEVPPAASPPPTSAGHPTSTEQTRLRNLAADLCLDIRGGTAKAGADTELAVCSSAWTQLWSYGSDGLLRSVANPELCLDSRADDGFVVLEPCAAEDAARGADVRYDLTARGELQPRWSDRLTVAPSSADPGSEIVVKVGDGSDAQRWRTDSFSANPDSLSISGTTSPPPPAGGAPSAGDSLPEPPDGQAPPNGQPGEQPPGAQPTGVPGDPEATPPESYQQPRSVTVGDNASREPVLPLLAQLDAQLDALIKGVGLLGPS